jgi:hypothetical protein
MTVHVDAAKVFGQGILSSSGRWLSTPFTEVQLKFAVGPKGFHSTGILELFPFISLLSSFPVRGKVIRVLCDSEAAVRAFRKGYSRDRPKMDILLRVLAAMCCYFECLILPTDISAQENQAADLLSRGKVEEFHELMNAGSPLKKLYQISLRSVPTQLCCNAQYLFS